MLTENAVAKANTFRAVAKEWFDRFSVTTTPRYALEVWARLERDVFPFIGNMPLGEIDAPTVLAILRRTEAREVITTTYKIKSHISQIFKFAIACGLAYTDPSRDLSAALTKKAPKTMAAIIDPREVGKLMLAIRGYAKETMTGHGFRAMANSLLAERGWSVDAIERQLAHVEGNKIRAAYHRSEHLEERKRMMQSWADYLDVLATAAGNGL